MKKQNIAAFVMVLSAMALLAACATATPEKLHEPDAIQHLSAAADISDSEDEPAEDAESIEESEAEKSPPGIVPMDTTLRRQWQQPAQQCSPSGTPAPPTPCEQTQQTETEPVGHNGIDPAQPQVADAGNSGNPASDENSVQSDTGINNAPVSNDPLTIINEARAAAGMPALSANESLNHAAQIRAQEAADAWGHTRPDGRDWNTVFADMGYSGGRASGETLASDGNGAVWLTSPRHIEVLLQSGWTHAGIGTHGSIIAAIFMNGTPQPLDREQPPAPTPGCWDFNSATWEWVRSPDCGCN